MTDFQADVPQQHQKAFDVVAVLRILRGAEQHHDVYVGAGQQLAATITAHCDQRGVGVAEQVLPAAHQDLIDQPAAPMDQVFDVVLRVGQKTTAQSQRWLRVAERLLQLGECKPGLERVAASAGCARGHNTAAFGAHVQMASPERRVST